MINYPIQMNFSFSGKWSFLLKITTAVINIPACAFFLNVLFDLFVKKSPHFSTLTLILLFAFLANMTMHMMLGMQTVIGDYIHHPSLLMMLKMGNALFCGLMFIMGCVGSIFLWSSGNV